MYAYHISKCLGSATCHWTLSLNSFQHFLIYVTCIFIVSSFIIKFCKCFCSWLLTHLCQYHVNWTPSFNRWWGRSCSLAVRGENIYFWRHYRYSKIEWFIVLANKSFSGLNWNLCVALEYVFSSNFPILSCSFYFHSFSYMFHWYMSW